MQKQSEPLRSAAQFLPDKKTLPELRDAAQGCKGCDLYLRGTQTVFGEGRSAASIMLVGEQPGDKEDQEGKPFVGPAGHLLDKCLAESGIDRNQVYVTNMVKHFKWVPRGKRRIHENPTRSRLQHAGPGLMPNWPRSNPKSLSALAQLQLRDCWAKRSES